MFQSQCFKPFTVGALLALGVATYLDWYWPWGLLFIYWAVPSVLTGEAFLVERITKTTNPILFWLITGIWVTFGIWTVYADVAWRIT